VAVRAVIQRVSEASVLVGGEPVGSLDGPGLLVYLGIAHEDGPAEIAWMARKLWTLRLLREEKSASDVEAPLLVVSQFTLYGEARKGRRPTWEAAAPREVSEPVYDAVCDALAGLGAVVARGRFGEDMQVASVNDGPITLVLESPRSAVGVRRRSRPRRRSRSGR
jgi:D-tyrosyl-tRNA(Tyr) deacylase